MQLLSCMPLPHLQLLSQPVDCQCFSLLWFFWKLTLKTCHIVPMLPTHSVCWCYYLLQKADCCILIPAFYYTVNVSSKLQALHKPLTPLRMSAGGQSLWSQSSISFMMHRSMSSRRLPLENPLPSHWLNHIRFLLLSFFITLYNGEFSIIIKRELGGSAWQTGTLLEQKKSNFCCIWMQECSLSWLASVPWIITMTKMFFDATPWSVDIRILCWRKKGFV